MKKNLPVTNHEQEFANDIRIVSTTDLKGVLTYVNDEFINISGFVKDELIGKSHNLVRHPDMPPAAFEDLWQTLKSGKAWMGIVKNRCKNGDYYWVDAHVTPLYEGEQVIGYQSVRTKPSQECVTRADDIYKRINSGKSVFSLINRIKLKLSKIVSLFAVLIPSFVYLLSAGHLSLLQALLTAGIGVLSALGFSFWYTKPQVSDTAVARNVFDNKLAQWIFTGRLDDSGQYQLAIKAQQSMLKTILGSVEDSAGHLGSLASSTSAVVEQTSKGVHQQQMEIDMVATAMQEMAATVEEVAVSTNSAMRAAQDTKEQATEGALTITEAIGIIGSLSVSVNEAEITINNLAKDSNEIDSVLDVITGIAEQTNLLALNAAIEAARAGEQGRGFAVVADEVRTLASRTQSSTHEIQTMIEKLQLAAQGAVKKMGYVRERSHEGVAQIEKSAESLTEIVGSITIVNDMSTQIASAAEEQSSVAEEVNKNINNINSVASETAAGAEETAQSSNQLSQMVTGLQSMVRQFSH